MKIRKFEDLDLWQKARDLCREINIVVNRDPFARDFGLKDQINRSSGSVMDNIAEGFERDGRKEFINFYRMRNHQLLKCGPSFTAPWIETMWMNRSLLASMARRFKSAKCWAAL